MRREFPLWSSVGAFCPSIIVNSTGAAIAAGTQISSLPPVTVNLDQFLQQRITPVMPEVYEFLEAERIKYAIRLPANRVLQDRIGYLLKRPVGRPPNEVRRFHANFSYQAGSWTKPRRVIAKVEWHPGELYPRVGFIVTNMSRPAERVVAFYNKRGTCEQWIKEGRLSCRTFAANAVRLQLHALAYNLCNFLRTLATPEPIKDWSLTSLKERLIKIGAKVVSHGRYVVFQMAEVAIPRH